jgi:hypothetical protein
MGRRCVSHTASAVTPETADGNSKNQRTRTNVNWKKLIPEPASPASVLVVLEGSSNQDFFSFSVAISVLLRILMPTLGSRYIGGQAGCVGELCPGLNDVNPIVTKRAGEYEYISGSRLR